MSDAVSITEIADRQTGNNEHVYIYVFTICQMIKLGMGVFWRIWEYVLCNAFNLFRHENGKGMQYIGERWTDLIWEIKV